MMAIRNESAAKASTIGRAVVSGLQKSHDAEIAQRREAAAALSNWSYQQQVLLQNQQMINAINRPRMTTCQYVGAYLQCSTF